jgi:NTP pyrophosphatase (non-canonical NTP hydrolase)
MEIKELMKELRIFLDERGWLSFSPNDVFIHLIEELGEIGKYLLFLSEYKTEEIGHEEPPKEKLSREFAQAFSLFMQLCIVLNIDLEKVWLEELEIMKKRFPIIDTQK